MEGQEGMSQQVKPSARPEGQAEKGAGGTQWGHSVGWRQGEQAATPVHVSSVGSAATAHEQAMECCSQSFL